VTAELPPPITPVASIQPPAPVPMPGRGRWIALGTAAVLSAVVVGGGVGFGVLQVVNKPKHQVAADRKAAPAKPPTYGALSNGDHFGSLSDLLLPVPGDMELGPDYYEFGNDTVLSASQYHAVFDKSISYLSTADRRVQEQDFEATHTQGYALRTYLDSDKTVITLALRQENQQFVTQNAQQRKHLADETGAYRPGPAVPGFPGTHCYLPPLTTGDKLDYMDCDASVGDMAVWMSVYGVAPLDSTSAVDLLSQQLTRLAVPGAQT
jgi:hypothetical protein